MSVVALGELISKVPQIRCGDDDYPVLSMTMHDGIVFQQDRFLKVIASRDTANYKVVKRGQLVVGFPINEGVIYPQTIVDAGIMSPAYTVWDIDQTSVDISYLNYCLHSPASMKYYADKLRGSTARRKSLPTPQLLALPIYLPPVDIQRQITAVLEKAQALIAARQEQIAMLDKLSQDLFVEMFGDPIHNNHGFKLCTLATAISHINNGMARRGKDADGNIVLRLVEVQSGNINYSAPNRAVLDKNEQSRYLLEDEDFLFARVNGSPDNVGRCAIYHDIGEPVFHNDHLIRVRFDKRLVDSEYMCHLLNAEYGRMEFKDKIKTSAGQYTVSQDGIKSVKVPLPDINEQQSFGVRIRLIKQQRSRLLISLTELENLYKSLTQRAFAGELFT